MALNVKVKVINSHITNEPVACARLVNQSTMSFDEFCDFMADGSTVTAADVAAVMKHLEKRLPVLFEMNHKVKITPSGLLLRPSVKGSITQSQLRVRLAEKAKECPDIDVNRRLEESDLTVSDLSAHIAMVIPKKLEEAIVGRAEFNRQ